MKRIALLLTAATLLTGPAIADDNHAKNMSGNVAGKIAIVDVWARATPGMAKTGAAYLTLKNGGAVADKLVGAKADVAERVEIHTTAMDNGIMRMREVEGGLVVPANGEVTLKPGGYHVMMMGLTTKLIEGESFPLTLTFEKSGTATVTVAIKAVGAMGSGHSGMGHGGAMPHGQMQHGK